MSLHTSLDGRNVLVYAQWESDDDLHAAADRPEVKAARTELDSHGEPDGTLFKVHSVYEPHRAPGGLLSIELIPERVTFVNLWILAAEEQQQKLLSAMIGDTAAIISKRGSRGMAYHTSFDGTRLVVYAQWDTLEAFDNAITNSAVALENRNTLARFGEPNANTYRLESVRLPIYRA